MQSCGYAFFMYSHCSTTADIQYKWNKEPNILNKNFIYFRLLVQLVVTKKPPNLNRFTIHILNMYVVNLRWTFHRETIDFISFIASIEWIRPLCKKLKLMQTIQLKKYYRIYWKKRTCGKIGTSRKWYIVAWISF